MAQMTKDFAENLLKRVQAGQHINTTVWEEEQLIRGWLYWHEHHYERIIKSFVDAQLQPITAGAGAAMSGDAFARPDAAQHQEPTEKK